ncbi:MAG: hypothetical protein DYH20_11375 [Gammaproteobacteria bacterium PRO9]|nr:hypothetical protein [Gammaproteobacteria bacterium PRO9]
MASQSRLGRQLVEILHSLEGIGAAYALIGGLALASYHVIRATQDVDLLTDVNLADAIDREIRKLGYDCIHRTADVANYVRGDQRVDLLFASRPVARELLAQAPEHQTVLGNLRVVGLEGLIGFKIQGLVNDPRRTQDLEDIRALLRNNRTTVNLAVVRSYFRIFDKEPLLDEILATID